MHSTARLLFKSTVGNNAQCNEQSQHFGSMQYQYHCANQTQKSFWSIVLLVIYALFGLFILSLSLPSCDWPRALRRRPNNPSQCPQKAARVTLPTMRTYCALLAPPSGGGTF
eukprot:3269091-Amphidinium_carterae.1